MDLEGLWYETDVRPGQKVNLMGNIWKDGEWFRLSINDTQGLMVIQPELSLSGSENTSTIAKFVMRA